MKGGEGRGAWAGAAWSKTGAAMVPGSDVCREGLGLPGGVDSEWVQIRDP
jgi:hypothetical protein